MRMKMKVILFWFFVFWTKIKCGYCQYGVYGGVQFQQPMAYQNYPQQQNIGPNRGYGYGYGPYNSYGPNNYVNSNYGNTQEPNLGTVLGDVSLAILRSLGEMLMGPEPDQFPYGPPGPFQPRNRAQNQFGYGVNAGVYAGTYGNGQNVAAGPYSNRNSHIGSSYSGLSGWPVLPWNPPFNPSTASSLTTLTSTTASSTTVTPLIATTLLQDVPLASVVELPLLETIEN